MEAIYEYVELMGSFDPPMFIGGYDDIPFTHEQWTAFIDSILKSENFSWDYENDDDGLVIRVRKMDDFVLRSIEMGEHVTQLVALKYYEQYFPEEAALAFAAK